MRSHRTARAKRGQSIAGKTGKSGRQINRAATTTASPGEQRTATERRLPGFDPQVLTSLGLTRREIAVLEQVAEGRTNEAIAASLELSPLTVKKHLERMSAKLGASNRAALVALAWQRSRHGEPPGGRARRRTAATGQAPI